MHGTDSQKEKDTYQKYPPSLAAVKMVPGSFGCGSAVFAAITILAPS